MYKQIKHFNGLNALRFFAAYFVVIHHAEQIRQKNEIFNLKDLSLFNNGGIAVNFFFVLSGFLISYLLFREQKETNNISIRKFYVRRILRIWPLYFLLVLIGTLIIPFLLNAINHPYEIPYAFKDVIFYYIFFSPFMVNILFGHHLLEPLWSIGVEELFYIIWAPLFKFLKTHLLVIILSIIALNIALKLVAPNLGFNSNVISIINMLQFESMAIGGLSAYIIYHRKKRIESSFIFSKPIQIVLITYILSRLLGHQFLSEESVLFDYLYNTKIISSIFLTCSFAWLIVNISINQNSILKLNNKVFDFLGDISYGVYMYHMLVIFAIILVFKNQLSILPDITGSILFYLMLTTGVILVSILSKRLFEDYFLSLKSKFREASIQKQINGIKTTFYSNANVKKNK
jgi:peptidoglycan/LPS O-acetylase OafA/YrhL